MAKQVSVFLNVAFLKFNIELSLVAINFCIIYINIIISTVEVSPSDAPLSPQLFNFKFNNL